MTAAIRGVLLDVRMDCDMVPVLERVLHVHGLVGSATERVLVGLFGMPREAP